MQCTIIVLFTLLVGVSALPAKAQTTSISKVEIIERGVYRAQTVSQRRTPGTTGVIGTVQNAQLISSTTTVLGMLGVRFGVRYVVVGHSGTEGRLRFVTTFPPGGLRIPETGQVIHQNDYWLSVPIGTILYWEYHFENQWEIVPGLWHFEFWNGMKKLAEQRFCIQTIADPNKCLGPAVLPGRTLPSRPFVRVGG